MFFNNIFYKNIKHVLCFFLQMNVFNIYGCMQDIKLSPPAKRVQNEASYEP